MKDLLIYIVKNIVEFPDDVTVNEVSKDDGIVLELSVNSSDIGKVIGRQGRIARAIRTLVKSAAIKSNQKVSVDIMS